MIPCIIPARGGSKGIPRKNIVELCGKPLIAWSIEQALASQYVDEAMVTTDCREIADVARQYGAKVFDRSPQTATDTASSESALLEVVSALYRHTEAILFLQATSPCRQPDDIDNAIQLFRNSGADSLFSARHVEGYTWSANGRVWSPSRERKPRQQESGETLEENGSIYLFKPSILLDHGTRLAGKIVPYLMHQLDSFQIDEPSDIPLVASLMEMRLDCHETAQN